MPQDLEILRALRQAGTGAVSGAELAQQLGLTRAAVWARIQELRALGYEIEASPHQGYRLLSAPDVLHADDLLARLGPTGVVGRDIRVFQETTSTNDIADKLARDGVAEGVVVFAESQTRGRGRLGRRWISPPGKGLWFSILLRPMLHPQAATRLTVVSAVALRRAIAQQTRLRPSIKWPNDILIGSRKVAGILTELSAEVDRTKHLILGLGIDVNVSPEEFPPELRRSVSSLQAESGRKLVRADLAVAVLSELDREYARLRSGDFAAIASEWEEHCATIGQQVVIRVGDREIAGRAEALSEDGALLVRTEHGRLERIVGGDVGVG
jgi:BirA family biotin operon repressor/biotin-[acetyl-CoA-carboxylase] ligase